MEAAHIQHSEGDYREHRVLGSASIPTKHQPQEENKMAKPRLTLGLSQKNARNIDVFKQYSKLSGIPLDDLLDECLAEYIYCAIEPHVTEMQQAATA
jgi:hypothetical protein